jgi:class 3 adenylate cyclase
MATPGQGRIERRLAAILAADVAGYSRLMGVDEASTARALREHRAAVDPIVREPRWQDRQDHRGRRAAGVPLHRRRSRVRGSCSEAHG